ncbi:hypothetical protein NG99_06255 [Erwinia typographi]|uniref:Uncharacterized protein n=1 Tax=Erwinia typographi TaxID=371042 RepID=A0A0A4AAX7_9GAMM|nr:hypothetical protein [Erwinia typographi]KGT94963.1 hypothetical protein NG99_06255 [Erwinia typographi]
MRKTIPFLYAGNEQDLIQLKENIQPLIPQLEEGLTGSLLWYSQNAQYVPESVKIISIEYLAESRYKMTYSFRWNVFNACLDIDADQTITETVNFKWYSGHLIFDFIDNQQATTADEL